MAGLLTVFSKYDFLDKDVAKIISAKPQLFDFSKEELQKRFKDLVHFGYPEGRLKKMVTKSPKLLLYDHKEATVYDRMKILQQINLYPRLNMEVALSLTERCPQLLTITDKSIFNNRVNNLMDYGLNKELTYQMVVKEPRLLLLTEHTVSEKMDYIVNELNGHPILVSKFPHVLTYSLKRLRERHLYLVQKKMFRKERKLNENQLRGLVLTSDEVFVTQVTKTYMEDFKKFQQKLQEEEEAKGNQNGKEGDQPTSSNTVNSRSSNTIDYTMKEEGSGSGEQDISKTVQRYVGAFGGNQRQQRMSDEEWYNTPWPEEEDADHDVAQRKAGKETSKSRHFTRDRAYNGNNRGYNRNSSADYRKY